MSKESFIAILTNLNKEEINKVIEQKVDKAKPYCPIEKIKKDN